MNTISTAVSAHDKIFALASEYEALISRMVDGEMLAAAPWGDPRFQELINRELGRHGAWREAADKLAVVKEVFSGK